MNATPPKDLLLERYAEAKAVMPDSLPSEPSAAVRERILASARDQINATKIIAPHARSTTSIPKNGIKNNTQNTTTNIEAANDSFWNIRAFGSLAVMGLAGLLWWQFEHGTPDEQEAARSAKPSPTVVATAPAPVPAPTPAPPFASPPVLSADSKLSAAAASAKSVAPSAQAAPPRSVQAPTYGSTPATSRKEVQTSKPSEEKIAAAEMAAPSPAATPAPITSPAATPAGASLPSATPETARARVQEAAPIIAAAPAPAPVVSQYSEADRAIAANAPARKSEATAAAPSARAAMPPPPAATAPAPMAAPRPAAPAPVAPPPPAFSRQTLLSAIEAKDAVALRQSLGFGISPNVIAPNGNLALTQAVAQRWAEGVRILLAAGADRNAKNNNGHTAVDVAIELGYADMTELLAIPR